MNRPKLSSRDRRALRLGLILATPVLLWSFAIRPYARQVGRYDESIGRERALLQSERTLLAAAGAYAARLLSIEEALAAQTGRAFRGPDAVSSTALFGSYLADLALDNDVRVDETRPGAARGGEAGTELRVTIEATGDIRGLIGWLRNIETGPRAIIVERLEIRAVGAEEFGPAPNEYPTPDGAEPLRIVIEALGFGFTSSASTAHP